MKRKNSALKNLSPNSTKNDNGNNKSYIDRSRLLKISMILVMFSTVCLLTKLILENNVSSLDRSLKILKMHEDGALQNVDNSMRFNNDVNYIRMHIGLLNLLHEKTEEIKLWHDQEINFRKVSINLAYAAAKGKLDDNASKEWSSINDSEQLKSIQEKYISEADKNNKKSVAQATEYENSISAINYWSLVLIIAATLTNSLGLILGFLSNYLREKEST